MLHLLPFASYPVPPHRRPPGPAAGHRRQATRSRRRPPGPAVWPAIRVASPRRVACTAPGSPLVGGLAWPLSKSDDFFDAPQRLCRQRAHFVRAPLEDGFKLRHVVDQFVVAPLDGFQRGNQPVGERGFKLAVALTRELCLDLLW